MSHKKSETNFRKVHKMTTETKTVAKKPATRVRKPAVKKTVAAAPAKKPMSPLQKALLSGTSPYAVFTAPPVK
jgi:hypothetical protein